MNFFETKPSEHITDLSNVDDVIKKLGFAKIGDLLVVDVDELLVAPKDKLLRPGVPQHLTNRLHNHIFPLKSEEKQARYANWIRQAEVEVVSTKLVETILKLQELGIKVIALTSLAPGAGKCGEIESIEDFRRDELLKFGIDFRKSFPELTVDLKLPAAGPSKRKPVFKDGILYNQPYVKEVVLKRFLKVIGESPDHIWFIDDNKSWTEGVFEDLSRSKIPITAINYKDANLHENTAEPTVANLQTTYFIETGKWLSDSAAKKKLQKFFRLSI